MTTLALDTATPSPSLAIVRGDELLAERSIPASVGAGRRVAEEVHELLGAASLTVADLDRIVVGVGPGGFTGLRIGMATALALGQALDVPVVGACSLETLALGMREAEPDALLVPVIDARRREVFTAAYRGSAAGGLEELMPPRAVAVDALPGVLDALPSGRTVLAGDGVPRVEEVIGERAVIVPAGPVHAIRAALAVAHVDRGAGRPVTPMYLRLPDAEVNRRARAAAGG